MAREVAHGFELWRSDGTEEGTFRVKDICAGECSSEPYLMGAFRGRFYFIASDGVTGRELWRTDGTAEGTWQVKSFCGPTPPCDPNTASYAPTAYQGRLLFGAANGNDYELWTSDGTTDGTYEVIDLCGGNTLGSTPRHFHEYHGEIYFETNCGPGSGPSLFKTDGTAEGTVQLASFPLTIARTGFVEFRDLLFFTAGGQLWRTDGTPQGTYGVADFGQMAHLSVMGDLLIFPATRTFYGRDTLWVSDGTGAGTRELPEGRFG